MNRMFTSPYRTVMSIAGVAMLMSSLLLVASPVAAAAPSSEPVSGQAAEVEVEAKAVVSQVPLASVAFSDTDTESPEVHHVDTPHESLVGLSINFEDAPSSRDLMGKIAGYYGDNTSVLQSGEVIFHTADASAINRYIALAKVLPGDAEIETLITGDVHIAGSAPSSNDPFNTYANNANGYANIELAELWADFDANGGSTDVVVAVLDTGLHMPTADIEAARITTDSEGTVLAYNAFTGESGDLSVVAETHSHGTFVATQIVGTFNNSVGGHGVCANRCTVMPVRVLDDQGSGHSSIVAAGITWAVDNGADVINMSLAGAGMPTEVVQAVDHALANDVVVIAAAGNSGKSLTGPNHPTVFPASIPGVLSVAAAKDDLSRESFSNYSQFEGGVDVAAPGCVYMHLDDQQFGSGNYKCGTSMAAPVVAAMAAMTRGVMPELSQSAITDRLIGFTSENDYTKFGFVLGADLVDPLVTAPIPDPPQVVPVSFKTSGMTYCHADMTHTVELTVENTSPAETVRLQHLVLGDGGGGVRSSYTQLENVLTDVPAQQTVTVTVEWPVNTELKYRVTYEGMSSAGFEEVLPVEDCVRNETVLVPVFACIDGNIVFDAKGDALRSTNAGVRLSFEKFSLSENGYVVTKWVSASSGRPWSGSIADTMLLNAGRGYTHSGSKDLYIVEPGATVRISSYVKTQTVSGPQTTFSYSDMYVSPEQCENGDSEGYVKPDGSPSDLAPELSPYPPPVEWFNPVVEVELLCIAGDDFALVGVEVTDFDNSTSALSGYLSIVDTSSGTVLASRSIDWFAPANVLSGGLYVGEPVTFDSSANNGHVGLFTHLEGASWEEGTDLNVDFSSQTCEPQPVEPPKGDPEPDPVDENPGDDPGEDDPEVGDPIDDPVVDDPINDSPITDDPVADDPVDERPTEEAAELVEGSRLTDTRNADGYGLPGGMIRYVQVAGVGDVPADATAATVNFTVAGAAGWGYLTAWSCDSADSTVPDSSILNYDSGWVRANTQTIGLGATGGICVWSYTDIDLLVDTQGFFNSPSVHMYTEPSRVADDRGANGLGDYNAGEVRRIEVGNDAVAAFVNLTVVNAKEWGFLTAWPCESEYDSPPNTSAANYDAGQTVANNALVSLNNGGFCVYSYGQTGVIVDLMGTIDENETSVVPLGSQRLVDTRTGASTIDGVHAGGGRIEAGQTRAFQITGRGNVPSFTLDSTSNPVGLSGVYLNVTSVNPQGTGGFLTIWACEHADEKVPNTSALNYNDRWSATPNSIVQKVNDGGQICIYAYKTTDVIVDVTGYVS